MATVLDGVNHVAILTRDMDRFIRFYQEAFDATVVHDNRNHAGHVGERMVIIMSFATQHELPEQSPRRDFLTNPHRLNVALTRAQRKLILVGCVPVLEGLPIFQRLITYCRSMRTLMACE